MNAHKIPDEGSPPKWKTRERANERPRAALLLGTARISIYFVDAAQDLMSHQIAMHTPAEVNTLRYMLEPHCRMLHFFMD